MPKRKTPPPEPAPEPEQFDALFYRIYEMRDTYPDAVYERYEHLADYVEANPDVNDLAVTDPRIQRLVEPFGRAYKPWLRGQREREGTGEEAFRGAVKELVDTLTDLVGQGDREGRERIIKGAIADFELAAEAGYANPDVFDPADWPFSY